MTRKDKKWKRECKSEIAGLAPSYHHTKDQRLQYNPWSILSWIICLQQVWSLCKVVFIELKLKILWYTLQNSEVCNNWKSFVSTDWGLPLPPALLSAPLSLCLRPLHPPPQWCRRRWWQWTLRWRWGGWEGPAEYQGSLCAGCHARGQEEATRRVRELKFTMSTSRLPTSLQSVTQSFWWMYNHHHIPRKILKVCGCEAKLKKKKS